MIFHLKTYWKRNRNRPASVSIDTSAVALALACLWPWRSSSSSRSLKTESIPISVYPYIALWLTIYVIRFFTDHCKKKERYLLHIATMCLAAVAQRKMVTICHLSSSSRHLKKVQRAGRQSSSFTVESSGVTRKKVSLYRPCTWHSMVEKISIHVCVEQKP